MRNSVASLWVELHWILNYCSVFKAGLNTNALQGSWKAQDLVFLISVWVLSEEELRRAVPVLRGRSFLNVSNPSIKAQLA